MITELDLLSDDLDGNARAINNNGVAVGLSSSTFRAVCWISR